jgi:hypothetical protein
MDPTDDWRSFLAEDSDLEEVEGLLAELVEIVKDDPAYVGPSLSALVDAAFRALLIVEDDAATRQRLLGPIATVLDAAIPATPPESLVGGLGLVRGATLRAAAGSGADPGKAIKRWLPAALAPDAVMADGDRTSWALACAATGFDDAVHELVGEPPLAFVPGASFGPDARSFARYLVAAAGERASSSELSTAWTSFVSFVPARIETGGLTWTDLLFAGFGAYHRVAGFPPGQVLDEIRAFVRELAAA